MESPLTPTHSDLYRRNKTQPDSLYVISALAWGKDYRGANRTMVLYPGPQHNLTLAMWQRQGLWMGLVTPAPAQSSCYTASSVIFPVQSPQEPSEVSTSLLLLLKWEYLNAAFKPLPGLASSCGPCRFPQFPNITQPAWRSFSFQRFPLLQSPAKMAYLVYQGLWCCYQIQGLFFRSKIFLVERCRTRET